MVSNQPPTALHVAPVGRGVHSDHAAPKFLHRQRRQIPLARGTQGRGRGGSEESGVVYQLRNQPLRTQ